VTTSRIGSWRATYTPGDWTVLAGPSSLVVLEPAAAERPEVLTAIWEEVLGARSIIDLASRLAGFGIETMPSFAALFWTSDGMRSLVRGAIAVTDLADGRVVANGTGVQTWTEVGLAGLDCARVDMQRPAEPQTQLPLVVGVVQAASLTLDATATAAVSSPQLASASGDAQDSAAFAAGRATGEEATEPVPDEHPTPTTGWYPPPPAPAPPATESAATELIAYPVDDDGPATQVMASPPPADETTGAEGVTASEGQEFVLAVSCPQGHANPSPTRQCRVCGQRVRRQTPRLQARPVLATLVPPDGEPCPLDAPVLVGRAPAADPDDAPTPRLLTVASPGQDISRTHVRIAPDGWQIVATDLHSTNGTVLMRPHADAELLTPGEPIVVPIGSVLQLGEGVRILVRDAEAE
jgi:hypothetical protein